MDDNTKRAKLLIKKATKGTNGTQSLSQVEKNLVLIIAELQSKIRKLEKQNTRNTVH